MFQFSHGHGHSLIAFAISLILAYALTPLVRRFSLRIGAVDHPKERKVHVQPIPTLGGIAIFVAFAAGALIGNEGLPGVLTVLPGILLGCLFMVAAGILDDLYDLRALWKLGCQIAVAAYAWWYGIRIDGFTDPTDMTAPYQWIELQPWQSAGVTIIWIVGITNTINLIDGLDGLAAGVSGMSAAALGLIAMQIPKGAPIAVLAAALCGSSLGFLRYNFNPARIFMGDTGSQLLGFLLAIISIQGPLKAATAVSIVVATLVLGVPVFDTAFAISRRLVNRKPIHHADRGHLHHRLVDRGLSQKQAVIVIYAVSCVLCGIAIFVFYRLV